MIRRVLLIGAFLTSGTAGFASCYGVGNPLFTCSFKGGAKQVNVCLQGDVVLYSFGQPDRAPDLLLGRNVVRVGFTPWAGVGSSIWEEISLHSDGFSYNLSYTIPRAPDGEFPSGQLRVLRGDTQVAELNCDIGSVDIHDFYPLYEAKQASGQQFCQDTRRWDFGC